MEDGRPRGVHFQGRRQGERRWRYDDISMQTFVILWELGPARGRLTHPNEKKGTDTGPSSVGQVPSESDSSEVFSAKIIFRSC